MNFSDRFLAIASSTTFSGNDPKRVAQTLREKGAIPEELLPFSDNIKTFNEYHSPNPLPSSLLKEGLKFLDKFEISYEWVTPTPENLMEELKYLQKEGWKTRAEIQDSTGISVGNIADLADQVSPKWRKHK